MEDLMGDTEFYTKIISGLLKTHNILLLIE